MAVGPGTGSSRTLGRYELIQELAKSQLGPLWVAFIPGGEELVAIRRVSTAAPVTAEERDALSEGAWWTLEVQHPSIAHGKDVVMSEGELGIVTEYTEGEVLRSLLRLSSFKRKPIPLRAGLRIALDALDAIREADVQAQPLSGGKSSYASGGLVPDSVLVGSDGKTRLLDVGVAGVCAGVSNVARNPEMVSYFSPEQIAESAVDIRANVYAVGVMLWEMLAGKRLYVGSTYTAVTERIQSGEAPRLDASKPVGGEPIPAAVADVVARALSSDAAERYASPSEFAEALQAAEEAATHADVAALVDDLAGNTLATRRKVIERAIKPGTGPGAKPAGFAKPAAKPAAAAAESPKPPMAVATKPGLAPPPVRERKQTLLGIAPPGQPPPRDKIESIDSLELESISKVEALPVEPTAGELVKALTSDADESPKPADADDPGTHLKTKVLGTPAVLPQIKPPPAPSTKTAEIAAEEDADEAPISLELMPDSTADASSDEGDEEELDEDDDAGDESRSSDESAVAWLGPPPGVALDEPNLDPEPSRARKKSMMKIVGGVTAGAAAVLLIGLAFGGKKEEDTVPEPAPAASAPAPTPKIEEPKPPEPETTAEQAKAEEPPAEEEPETKDEPAAEEAKTAEAPAPAPTPKPVARPIYRPRTTATKSTTKTTKPKTKPSFTPSGI